MYLFVDRTAFVCGFLHTCARIYETLLTAQTASVFFNMDVSVANQMSSCLRGAVLISGLTPSTIE